MAMDCRKAQHVQVGKTPDLCLLFACHLSTDSYADVEPQVSWQVRAHANLWIFLQRMKRLASYLLNKPSILQKNIQNQESSYWP